MKPWMIGFLLLGLMACGAEPLDGGTISGTVYAPAEGNVQGTVVVACFVVGDDCDQKKSNAISIAQSGNKAAYSIANLAQGDYAIVALQGQFDAAGELTSLTSLGMYTKGSSGNQKFTLVRPSKSGVDVSLLSISNPDAGGGVVQPGPGSTLPQELQAEFFIGSPSGLGFYNPSTGQFAQASGHIQAFIFQPDGTFVQNWLYETGLYGCSSTLFSSSSGTVQLNGSKMTLNTTSGRVKFINSCNASQNYDRAIAPKSRTYTWQVAPDADSPSVTYLQLTDAEGLTVKYVKKQ